MLFSCVRVDDQWLWLCKERNNFLTKSQAECIELHYVVVLLPLKLLLFSFSRHLVAYHIFIIQCLP